MSTIQIVIPVVSVEKKNKAHKAFTTFQIYVEVFVEPMSRHVIREDKDGKSFVGHPVYESLKKSLEAMVKEEKISRRLD